MKPVIYLKNSQWFSPRCSSCLYASSRSSHHPLATAARSPPPFKPNLTCLSFDLQPHSLPLSCVHQRLVHLGDATAFRPPEGSCACLPLLFHNRPPSTPAQLADAAAACSHAHYFRVDLSVSTMDSCPAFRFFQSGIHRHSADG